MPGSGITCKATQINDISQADPGKCATTAGPSAGANALVGCAIGGRACEDIMTASDGTQYCAAMPTVDQTTSGCFDPTTTTAQEFCQRGLQFTIPSDGGVNVADEFAYWEVEGVARYASAAVCAAAYAADNP